MIIYIEWIEKLCVNTLINNYSNAINCSIGSGQANQMSKLGDLILIRLFVNRAV
jgi:hypothetical protein